MEFVCGRGMSSYDPAFQRLVHLYINLLQYTITGLEKLSLRQNLISDAAALQSLASKPGRVCGCCPLFCGSGASLCVRPLYQALHR